MRRFLLVPILTVVLLSVPNAARATTSTSCAFNSGTATVTATIGSGQSPTLERSGDAITFGGSVCGAATVTNTDTINVGAPDHVTTEGITVSIAGGPFAPGKTSGADGNDEIEIALSLDGDEPLTVMGSAGPDAIRIRGTGTYQIPGASPSDLEITYPLTTATKTLLGGPGDDILEMDNVYASVVDGGDGNDTISPANFTPSSYDGGDGADTIDYSSALLAFGVTVHADVGGSATAARDNGSGVAVDTLTGFETIVGTAANDTFYGSTEADHFVGGGGNDWFLPRGGDDHIDGGGGLDTMSVGASASPVTFAMTAKTATGEGSDTFDGIDILQGSPSNDLFTGDPELGGVIVLDGYGGQDLLDLRSAASGQTVYTSDVAYGPGPVVTVGITHIIGSPFHDKIVVDQTPSVGGSVRFSGAGGNDRLIGGPRRDDLAGGPGNDTLNGKGNIDTCSGGPGVDTLLSCER